MDEIGYLPLDKSGADLLFQIISQRYERGSIIVTTNKAYKHWPRIFNNDAGITSAILDRLFHRAPTVVIEGKSYRMKDRHRRTHLIIISAAGSVNRPGGASRPVSILLSAKNVDVRTAAHSLTPFLPANFELGRRFN